MTNPGTTPNDLPDPKAAPSPGSTPPVAAPATAPEAFSVPPPAPRPPRAPKPVRPRFTHVVIEPAAVASLLAAWGSSTDAEPCGLVVGKRAGETAIVRGAIPIPNAHVQPDRGFLLSTREALEQARAAGVAGHAILGTFHGHLRGAPFPSAADIAGLQAASLGPGNAAAPNALPHVFLIVGRSSGPKPVIRAWTWREQRLRELPMRTPAPELASV
jgi:proteasome lid subunit RPN8/RPN11